MAKKKRKTTINLIPREGLTATTSGRILVWALSTFRVVVIVTEIIVMIAFLSRFWLDAQNTDLNDEIRQKRAVLEATQNFQKEFENTQALLSIYSEYTQERGRIPGSFEGITKSLPAREDFYLTRITYSGAKLNLEGLSLDEFSIQQFVTNLADKDVFESVILNSVETSEENEPYIKFIINITAI